MGCNCIQFAHYANAIVCVLQVQAHACFFSSHSLCTDAICPEVFRVSIKLQLLNIYVFQNQHIQPGSMAEQSGYTSTCVWIKTGMLPAVVQARRGIALCSDTTDGFFLKTTSLSTLIRRMFSRLFTEILSTLQRSTKHLQENETEHHKYCSMSAQKSLSSVEKIWQHYYLLKNNSE